VAFVDTLAATRDSLAAEFQAECARRKALTDQGLVPPVSYSIDGRSVPWNDYISMMAQKLIDLNKAVVEAGGDGGVGEYRIIGYSG
jgi:hypothetical protein